MCSVFPDAVLVQIQVRQTLQVLAALYCHGTFLLDLIVVKVKLLEVLQVRCDAQVLNTFILELVLAN